MKYMIIAGEASGDLHASGLIKNIRKLDPQADIRFFGGDLMAKEARRNPELHYNEMNVMGFSEVIRKLPQILSHLRKAKNLLRTFRPDTLILVDYPSFNLKLAKEAHKLGIKVNYFISPKIWAWKEWRIKDIKKYVDAMYSILPFEIPFYQGHNYKATYVGNPSVGEIEESMGHIPPLKHFLERQGIDNDGKPIIAILPGSRKGEIRNNLPLMIEAAKRFPDYKYIVAAAPSISEKFYRLTAQDPGLSLAFGATHTLLKYAKAAIVTSGTATLETALIGTPQVVCYRSNGRKIAYKIMEKLLKIKYVSLPNLIVNNNIVPELLVHRCTIDNIARELSPLLQPSPQRDWQLAGYKNMRRKLGNSVATEYAAELIVSSLRGLAAPDRPAPTRENPPRKKSPRRNPTRENPSRENPSRENSTRENSSRENPTREKSSREKSSRENGPHEKSSREKESRENSAGKSDLDRGLNEVRTRGGAKRS